jgi:hypothetical protein
MKNICIIRFITNADVIIFLLSSLTIPSQDTFEDTYDENIDTLYKINITIKNNINSNILSIYNIPL